MAVGPWVIFDEALKYLATGEIDVDAATFRMSLYTSASNAGTTSLSTLSQLTNEVAEANGYSSSGKALTGVTWAPGASARVYRFDSTALVWTATGGAISNVKFAVIWVAGASAGARKLVARCQLSTAQYTIGQNNTLTVTPSAQGIFELAAAA